MARIAGIVVLFAAIVFGLATLVLDLGPGAEGVPPSTSGGGPTQVERVHPQGGILRGAAPAPATLNPFTTTDSVAVRYVLPFSHDTLYDRDPTSGALRPAAATSHAWTDERKTLTFTLRDDLRFSDGSPVTVDDLRFTLDTARNARVAPQSDMSYWLAQTAEATAPDARTIVVRYAEPLARSTFALLATSVRPTQRAFFVGAVREFAAEAVPGSDAFIDSLCALGDPGPGTGPYRLRQSLHDARTQGRIELVRNDASWRREAQPGAWNLDTVRIEFVIDDNVRFTRLERNELDWFSPSGGPTIAELLEEDPQLAENYATYSYDPAHVGHYLVYWNHRRPPLDDPIVRRALGMLFDRQTLLDEVFHGLGTVARGYFKPGMPEYPNDAPEPVFSPERARALLAERGIGPGVGEPLEVEILVAPAATIRRIVEIAADAFETAGVRLVPRSLDELTVYRRFQERDFDGVVLVQQHDAVIDPYDSFHSSGNAMGYANAELDGVIEAARMATDPARRIELYGFFNDILRRDEPVTLLIHPRIELLLHRRFEDAAPGVLGLWHERFWVAR